MTPKQFDEEWEKSAANAAKFFPRFHDSKSTVAIMVAAELTKIAADKNHALYDNPLLPEVLYLRYSEMMK